VSDPHLPPKILVLSRRPLVNGPLEIDYTICPAPSLAEIVDQRNR
jgi:hypothetical protein